MTSADVRIADNLAVQQIRSFCVVFEKQSYAAAAAELHLAVPTIWEQVRALEKQYQAALFVRRGRRIESTPTAALLYESLRSLLSGLDSTFELVREEGGNYPRTVTLVTGARMMLEDLGRPLKQFRDRYPHICLRLLHDHDKDAEELVVQGQADLALTLEPGPGLVGPGIVSQRAYQIDYLAVFPKRHPLARKATLTLGDLAAQPLIVGHVKTYGRQLLEEAFHHAGLLERVKVVAETDTSAFTIACVRAGMGVGVVAGRPTGILSRDLVTRSLASHLGQAWIAFLWKRGKHLTVSVQTLVQLISRAAENGSGCRGKRLPTQRHAK
ncbi:MAG TPA: LysR family transcriptional regulator [Pirellulaceae bacterium]|jgi:DNA-binding transcriptional LysR family regulator